MPRVPAELEFETLAECKYNFPAEALRDIRNVTATYGDLRMYVDFYSYPNKEKKKLVCLAGTIPVPYDGNTYNIPVRIWLHQTHPQNQPRCHVCPSGSMVINLRCPCVDASGHVSLICLNNWKSGQSSLAQVVAEMRSAFLKETPLFATLRAETLPTPAHRAHAECLDAHGQHLSDGGWLNPSSYSTQTVGQSLMQTPRERAPPNGLKSSQSEVVGESRVRRSYTEELLEIDFRPPDPPLQYSSSNPFIGSGLAPNATPSSSGDISNLFSSLQLENVVNMYQLETKDNTSKGAATLSHTPSGESQTTPKPSPTPLALVDDSHRVLVNKLPVGVVPRHMKNKLTLYFQRKTNGGGEVLDVTYPAAQPDQACITFHSSIDAEQVLQQANRIITLNNKPVLIQLRSFDSCQTPIPDVISGDKAAMFRSLLSLEGQSFTPADVQEAVQLCSDFPSALKFLSHECPICQEMMSFCKIVTMTHCSCAFCEACFKAYFSAAIKEKSIAHMVCPLCSQPDVRTQGLTEGLMDYFSLLDTKIRHYLDPQTHELFQRKLRDRALQEMPNFRWCAHCSFGLLHEADRLRMDCPSCGKSTCSRCKTAWATQHEGLSCQKFKEWKLHNDPEHHTTRLEILLNKNKIECPKCEFVFYLSKGGCLHFKCTQCQHEFCGSCKRSFKLGSACKFSAECGTKGLHAHHPRDCLYHLRDWSVTRLHKLLQHYRVSLSNRIKEDFTKTGFRGVCAVLELRDTGGRKEEPCGRPALTEHNGYCALHYKEYLVEIINRSQADPAVLFDAAEIVTELQRWHVPVPQRKPQEPEPLYIHRLRLILTQSVRLRDHGTPVKVKGHLCPPMGSMWPAAQDISASGFSEDSQLLLLLND
ncbi:E3 ubiquitin-protein ligase lubel [Osmerus mordax]|uniref:E3 ubiquitin-protein ligase lubel n=1 Tax=Osmerus mordax TaxID=8014 RepID=UPI00350F7B90